jgi:Zn-dependent protease
MTTETEARLLARTAELVGSVEQLAALLKVPVSAVAHWIQREGELPGDVFLRAIDIFMEAEAQSADTPGEGGGSGR